MRKQVISLITTAFILIAALSGCSDSSPESSPIFTASQPAPAVDLPPLPELPEVPKVRSVDERVEDLVAKDYATFGLEIESQQWQDLSDYICDDLAKGGAGLWTTPDSQSLSPEDQYTISVLNLDGAILSSCPEGQGLSEWKSNYYGSPLSARLAYSESLELQARSLEYQKLLTRYNQQLIEYGRKYNVDTSPLLAYSQSGGTTSGGGYSVTCRDGTISESGGKSGACSHHGGVR